MISFSAEPFVVTLDDGNEADDGGDILLLGLDARGGTKQALILAAGKFTWYDLEKVTVVGQLLRVEEETVSVKKEAPDA